MNVNRSVIETATNTNDIKWLIEPSALWEYFNENKERLRDEMVPVCKSQFDDEESVWWLFVTADFNDENAMILSLEDANAIIDSENISGPNNIIDSIEHLLAAI